MDNNDKTKAREIGISDNEKNRIFVTMNATFKDEKRCKEAMETIVNDAHAAYGVNSHFWFRSKDGKSLFVLEQYADEKALIEHVMENPTSRAAFFESIEVNDVTVYGTESDTIKETFATFNPTYMNYYGGYSK